MTVEHQRQATGSVPAHPAASETESALLSIRCLDLLFPGTSFA